MKRARRALLGLLLAALPATAQVPPASARAADAPVDPARVAAARPVVDRVWPLGTFRRMMETAVERIMGGVFGEIGNVKAGPLAGPGDAAPSLSPADATLAEVARRSDPAFDERMRITARVTAEEEATLMARIEPDVRAALARALARRFDAAELRQLDAFFATPVGARYASESILLGTDPEMMAAMTKFIPLFMDAMPEVEKKIAAATAHLPPPPAAGTRVK